MMAMIMAAIMMAVAMNANTHTNASDMHANGGGVCRAGTKEGKSKD